MFVYFVYVYVCACLYECIHVNVFHGEKLHLFFLNVFRSPTGAEAALVTQ